MTDAKTCTQCGELLPLTAEYFGRRKGDKWRCECKKCGARLAREYHAKNRAQVLKKMRKYHLDHIEQAHQRNASWRAEHREQRLVQLREWHQASKSQRNAYSRQYYVEHRDEILARTYRYQAVNRERIRNYVRSNRERFAQRTRRYREANPEQVKAITHRRHARKRALPAVYNADHWRAALDYFEGKCAVCGRPVGFFHTLAADHWVPLSSPECPGTVVTNIVPLCHGIDGCNNRKHARPARAWLVEQFGARKAKQIEKRIAEFLAYMAGRFPLESDGQYGEGAERPHQTRFDGHRHAGNHSGGQ